MILIQILDFNSRLFPDSLKNIKNPPTKIYCEGNLDLLNSYSISIIGSRACSIDGINFAKSFAKDLVYQGITITSGMAVGIDTAAHIGALESNGNTIAVLGCGFNNIFPKENIKLFNRIIENNGLIISEYPQNEPARSENFLARNRLISALSIGILVIESAYRSGTSVTCKIGKEQNKKIFCIPHELNNKYGVGTNKLIKKGAYLVTSTKDIIDKFDFLEYKSQLKSINKSKIIKINPKYLDIYNLLIGPPLNVDQICDKLDKSASEINNALFMLELDGAIIKTKFGYQANNF